MPNALQTSIYCFDPLIGQLEVLEKGIAMFHGYANVAFAYGRGEMLAVDTSSRTMGAIAVAKVREVTAEPFAFLIYSHGLGDHAFGTEAFIRDAMTRGFARPKIWAHEAVAGRSDEFRMTRGWHAHINRMQIGDARMQFSDASAAAEMFDDDTFSYPDLTYRGTQFLDLAGEPVELHHAMAETDDATWVWMPARRLAMVGDLIISATSSAGNPNSAQHYTLEWAETLKRIAHRKPQYVLPGHGPAYQGEQMCEKLLTGTARALRYVHDEVVRRLNAGEWPIDIVEENIALPDDLAGQPFLQPLNGCVPFIVRDVIRRYAGWWSGEPSQMIPAPRKQHSADIVELCGRDVVVARARSLRQQGETKRALALAEIALNANPKDAELRALNAEILDEMASSERSLVARNLLTAAAAQLKNPAK
jgi:alkyl sulfatase BDS1-like metallo-beta-lactamase superfamily hydrolase